MFWLLQPVTFQPIKVILAKNLVEKQFNGKYKPAENQEQLSSFCKDDKEIPFIILKEFTGKDMIGIRYEQLLDYVLPSSHPENAFRVISGDFVTTEDGTGVVHTAPTLGQTTLW